MIEASFTSRGTQTTSARSSFNSVSHHLLSHTKLPLTSKAIYMIAVSSAADGGVGGQAFKALYATIVGPFFLTILLMFVSGLPLSERPKAKQRWEKGSNYEGYKRWLDRTSILIPFPPQIYEKVPTFLKRTLFLEFPMYVFDPKKHSDVKAGGAAEEEGRVGDGQGVRGDGEENRGRSP